MKKNFCVFILGFLLFVSCSTPYKARGFFGNGYHEYQLQQDRFAVIFRGNEHTDPETVRKFALKRAAEVTLDHGFSFFILLSEKDISRRSFESEYFTVQRVAEKQAPGLELLIQCYTQKPGKEAMDAKEILFYNPS